MSKIQEKGMLIRLSIGQWTARKLDKKVTNEISAQKAASADAGRYNKLLIAENEIKKIQKISNEARIYHYEQTLLWNDDGNRLLPSANYFNYQAKMSQFKIDFENAVDNFILAYPALIADAQIRLNGMFNFSDYPTTDKIKTKYYFQTEINPIPNASDFRIDLNTEEVETIKKEIEEKTTRTINEAMKELYKRLFEVINHAAEALSDPEKIFRDSLIDNIRDICAIIPTLNITNDENLNSLAAEAKEKLAQQSPQNLREYGHHRQKAAENAKEIVNKMKDFF